MLYMLINILPRTGSHHYLRQILIINCLQRKSVRGRIRGAKVEVLTNFSPCKLLTTNNIVPASAVDICP